MTIGPMNCPPSVNTAADDQLLRKANTAIGRAVQTAV